MNNPPLAVFISYAREDAEAALKLYSDLNAASVEAWLDQKNLKAGQRWKRAIEEAIAHSRYFIALISSHSVDKRGYVQKEVKQALEVLKEFPESDIFIIPVRLDECKPTSLELRDLQWVDLFPNWNSGIERILTAMGLESDRAAGQRLLDILKRLYVECNGDEDRMLVAIRGLKGHIDPNSHTVTREEWDYLDANCPSSIMEKLKSILQEPRGGRVKKDFKPTPKSKKIT